MSPQLAAPFIVRFDSNQGLHRADSKIAIPPGARYRTASNRRNQTIELVTICSSSSENGVSSDGDKLQMAATRLGQRAEAGPRLECEGKPKSGCPLLCEAGMG